MSQPFKKKSLTTYCLPNWQPVGRLFLNTAINVPPAEDRMNTRRCASRGYECGTPTAVLQ